MSMVYMVKAMHCKVGSPIRKLVLIKLADNANDKGECWPSYNYIADVCEVSRRVVMSHVNSLCEMGYLEKKSRKGVKGNSTNLYTITIPKGELDSPPPSERNSLPSEADSPPPSERNSLPSEADSPPPSERNSLPSEADSPPPSEPDAPGISHSFESVSESVTPNSSTSQAKRDQYDFDLALNEWNKFAEVNGLAKINLVGDKRERVIKQSYQTANKLQKKAGGEPLEFSDFVVKYLTRAHHAMTDFHRGEEKGSKWKANFNYVFAKDVTETLLTEGELRR